jgi:prepilin-type N-terminal cleavage/methylation domain-containing protein
MQPRSFKSIDGFSLLEMLIAMSLGLVLVASAVQMYSKATDATFTVSQRAEMQQDMRAAEDMMVKDISLAGAGLQPGGVAVASGTGTNPKYGCDQVKCYIGGGTTPAGIALPGNYLYWIIPGPAQGVTLNAAVGPTDVITVVYADTAFQLNQYQVTFNNANGTSVNFSLPAVPPNPLPQPVSAQDVGLKTGDLVLFSNTVGGNTAMAVGEVTGNVAGASSPYTALFANSDALQFNQVAATAGDLKQIAGGANTTALRIFVITYYIDVLPNPSGAGLGTPRLMRQVNGQIPVPVAENVADLRITYDTYDNNGNLLVDQRDAGASVGVQPNMIRKVNIKHLTVRSALRGVKGYQSMDIQTSVSARNMSFKDRYQ